MGVGKVETSTPHSVHRTAGLIRRDSPELYRLVLAVSGSPILSQDGRSVRLAPGGFALYDFTRPYELAYDAAVRLAVFSFPRELLSLPARRGHLDHRRAHPGRARAPPRWPRRCCAGWRWTWRPTGRPAPRGCPRW
ncbi:hypothetical protein ACFSTC_36500 [Nonomuraea ferruginea]